MLNLWFKKDFQIDKINNALLKSVILKSFLQSLFY